MASSMEMGELSLQHYGHLVLVALTDRDGEEDVLGGWQQAMLAGWKRDAGYGRTPGHHDQNRIQKKLYHGCLGDHRTTVEAPLRVINKAATTPAEITDHFVDQSTVCENAAAGSQMHEPANTGSFDHECA